MTKTFSVKEVSMQTIIALTRNGDEIVLEENGEPLARRLNAVRGEAVRGAEAD